MKNPLPAAIVIAVLGCGLAANAYITSATMRQNLQEERFKRLTAEEHLQNTKSEMAKIRSDLGSAQKTLMAIQELVSKGKDVNLDLKAELESLRRERDAYRGKLEKVISANAVVAPAPTAPATAN